MVKVRPQAVPQWSSQARHFQRSKSHDDNLNSPKRSSIALEPVDHTVTNDQSKLRAHLTTR